VVVEVDTAVVLVAVMEAVLVEVTVVETSRAMEAVAPLAEPQEADTAKNPF
jgi:hypothetical protein